MPSLLRTATLVTSAVALAAGAPLAGSAAGEAEKYTSLVVFGDSFSDDGKFSKMPSPLMFET